MTKRIPPAGFKGRGALANPGVRFDRNQAEEIDDGWYQEDPPDRIETELLVDSSRSVIARNDSPDVGFDQSINPYRGCEHGCIFCLSGDTPILMGDGTTRALERIRVGDQIYGTVRAGNYRRYTRTRVLAHWSVIKPAWRITLEDGTALTAGADHRFLTERGWKFVTGTEQGANRRPHLTCGNKLMGVGRFAVEGQRVKSNARLRVISVEPTGKTMRLYDITTGTEDFIANGVVSHNCYARPSHAYLGMSPGIDFETRLVYKPDAAQILRQELARPGYVCKHIMLGSNTDPYQPVERRLGITRSILEVLAETRHPVAITTRSTLLLRDLDLLTPMAKQGLVMVMCSITTFDSDLKRKLEPRSAASEARLHIIRALRHAGIPVGVLVAPMIPAVNDSELETILERSAEAGARHAGYVLLRLPLEVRDLFRQWLSVHMPDRAEHVMSLINDAREGRDNSSQFGTRMRGTGVWAKLLRDRFKLASRKLGFVDERRIELATHLFKRPERCGQLGMDF
jgi:DNA repair photolyase